jgi:dolichyl-phosphate-mannose-protein mannosyltransferase
MMSPPPRKGAGLSRETWVVIALTLCGGLLRAWSPGRLGLVHFDEGIYALAGLWCFSPGGLAGIDPAVISYAPPGFPILVGLSYLVFGVNDLAAILVSICTGTLSIPLVAWLAHRAFGRGAGGAAAAFAALSGPHVAFSRMALTDVSFLFTWLFALALGQKFLERPSPGRAAIFGCAVGLAQLFKYNGWISGAIVVTCAICDLVVHPARWQTRSTAATWGWGLLAVACACMVYWPWFRFVDLHGGYGALLAHQRSYLGGLASWPRHLALQLNQTEFLSGGPRWLACTGVAAGLAAAIGLWDDLLSPGAIWTVFLATLAVVALCLVPGFSCTVAIVFLLVGTLLTRRPGRTRSVQLPAVGWALLGVLTPFYHPYARLWLPIEAIGWLFLGGGVAISQSWLAAPTGPMASTRAGGSRRLSALALALSALVIAVIFWRSQTTNPHIPPLAPSDSIRRATASLLSAVPKNTGEIRGFVRPPLLFYLALASNIAVMRQPDLAHALDPRNSASWAIIDGALVRQDKLPNFDLSGHLAGWVVVLEVPTTLNAPTLLDIDPAAATATAIDRSASFWLLRPRGMEDVP